MNNSRSNSTRQSVRIAARFALFLAAMIGPEHARSDNSVREILRVPGQPLEVIFNDGRVATVVRREKIEEFRVPVQLGENSCSAHAGISCSFVMPFVRQQFAAVWKRHPTREGRPLEYSFNGSITFGAQNFITQSQSELFDKVLRRIPAVLSDRSMARIECASADADLLQKSLPTNRTLLYWDENFEGGNAELAIAKGFGARVNQTWRRFEDFELDLQGATLRIPRFKKPYGMFTDYYPFGLSYQIQMTFLASNIVEPRDESCELRWDVSFTSYFTQLISVLSGGGSGTMNPATYKVFEESDENKNPYAQKIYEKSLWEDKGMH